MLVLGSMLGWATGLSSGKLTSEAWRSHVREEVGRHCESYEWDAACSESAGDLIHLHNLVVRRALADDFFAMFGMRVAEPDAGGRLTIGTLRLVVTFKLESSLGIFLSLIHI